jgi:hypothetical protein
VRRALLLPLVLAAATAGAAESSLVVWLPATPVESSARVGEAVTDLGAYLNRRVPGLKLTVRPFRRSEDAMTYLQASGRDVSLLLTESAFLMDLPADFSIVPGCRLVRGGKETHRKIVVAGAGDAHASSLVDLKGRSLSLAITGGEQTMRFLGRAVFEGEIAPETWFGKIVPETDELTATADVLYGRADAALVSEDNPLVVSRLGKDLKVVYTSPVLSLPVLVYRSAAVSAGDQAAIETALQALGATAEGKKILEGLRIDGFARIKEGTGRLERAGLLTLPTEERREPEIVVAGVRDLGLPDLPPAEPGKVPFLIGFTLPDLPMPVLEAQTGSKVP